MTNWLPDRAKLKRPVYKTLQSLIIDAIDRGELRPGERMPTHREFAYQLDISVQTISRTYDALCKLGYLTGEIGRGTFVRMRDSSETNMPFLPDRRTELIDLSMLRPVCTSMHYDILKKGLSELSDGLSQDLVTSFRAEEVFREHFLVMARWFKRQGIHIDPKNLIFTNGAIPALQSAVMTVAPPGSAICVEEVSFHNLRPLTDYLGVRMHAAAMDDEGLKPEAFELLVKQYPIRAVVLSPTVVNPKAYVMGIERRREILDIARRHNVHVIENDVLGSMIKDAPPSLCQLDPDLVFYITSFSKTVMPGLRAGVLIVPPSLRVAAKNRHLVTSWMANPITIDLLIGWIEDGTIDRLIAWQADALKRRQIIAAKILDGKEYSSHQYASHLWLPLPSEWKEDEFVNLARRHQVAIAGSLPFMMTEQSNEGDDLKLNAVRIALGPCSENRLAEGLRVIASLLDTSSETPLPMF